MTSNLSQRHRRTRRAAGLVGAGALALALAGLWAERRNIAGSLIDRRLAEAGVPAHYRLAEFGPGVQVIEQVRIGPAAAPDLIARRVVLHWRYRLGWPVLAGIEIDGARMRARWQDGRLSLGALDRLLPAGGGKAAGLPDLALRIADGRVTLATSAGEVRASLAGAGNPARSFRGVAGIDAGPLVTHGCTLPFARGRLTLASTRGVPTLAGPLAIGAAGCTGVRSAPGTLTLALRSDAALARIGGRIGLRGFALTAGANRLGPLAGQIELAAMSPLAGTLALRAAGAAGPDVSAASLGFEGRFAQGAKFALAGRLTGSGVRAGNEARARLEDLRAGAASSPAGPLVTRLTQALGDFAGGSALELPLTLHVGGATQLAVTGGAIRSAGGRVARLGAAVRLAGDVREASATLAGDDLPALAAEGRLVGRDVDATLRLADYAAGATRLALAPLRLRGRDGDLSFATQARFDGSSGAIGVRGLAVPLVGSVSSRGGVRLGEGCSRVTVERVAAAGLVLDPARLRLCGAPLVAVPPGGGLRLAATVRDLALTGHSGAAPVRLAAARLDVRERGFVAEEVAVRLGAEPDPTRLDLARLDGRFAAGGVQGAFEQGQGAIARVPLDITGARGTWRVAGGRLHLGGGLHVADQAAAPRFLPLRTDDLALDLVDGRITATAALHAPASGTLVTNVTLEHRLASGIGHAQLAVPALVFARKGLQPEQLTPLTLGVIANVAGTLRGEGRIDWSPRGTTSRGRFTTERMNLAAAFGPVSGLSGTLVFSDLLGLVSPPHQEARVAEINPGVAVADGVIHYQLTGDNRVAVEDARWPFAGGTLALDPTLLDFGRSVDRRLTFRVQALDAARFIQQLDFPNISATGTFDGRLPMIFDERGGRIEEGYLRARGPGTLAYVGELSQAQLGTLGKLAFDALKAIRYSGLDIALGGRLDGEIVTRVRFDGVARATGDKGIVARAIRNLPFRFNIGIRAPFRGLVASARSYADPSLLLQQATPVQPADSAPVAQETRP